MSEQITTAGAYHFATRHVRNRIKPHYLDFQNYPGPEKSYDFLTRVDLDKNRWGSGGDLHALFHLKNQSKSQGPVDFATLSRILFIAYGVTGNAGKGRYPNKSVPSAGGLYPCHLYIVINWVSGLETGLYYYNMTESFLGLIQRCKNLPGNREDSVFSLIITGEYFNSSWKYRERAFRYILLDAGHLVENVLLALKSCDLAVSVHNDFDDAGVSEMLLLDFKTEVPLVCINIGMEAGQKQAPFRTDTCLAGPGAEALLPASPVVYYSLLQDIYALGRGVKESDEPVQQPGLLKREPVKTIPGLETFESPGIRELTGDINFTETVFLRRSKRNFIPEELDKNRAQYFLKMATSLSQTGEKSRVDSHLVMGFSCQRVQGLQDGFYLFSQDRSCYHLISPGQYQAALAGVCLDQKWIANAGINFLFISDLSALEKEFGPRGYRYLLMHAGRVAQRIYLAATGLGLGACGVGALYDPEAQDLFDLDDPEMLFYVVATGRVKK